MGPSNKAAFLGAKLAPLQIKDNPYTKPCENEIIIKNGAIAINPYDYIIQEAPNLVVSWVKLPFPLGTDVAGEVVEVGKDVTRFKTGDRVVAHAAGLNKKVNRPAEGGFQQYTVIRAHMASLLPAAVSYERAAVLPLGLSTAACALFQKDFLSLPHPSISPRMTNETLLIWGGSTSVGNNAIQLARAAGYQVITTGSPRNHQLLKDLGADEVYDYNSPDAVKDIIAAFKLRTCAGAVAIGKNSFKKCVDIVGAAKGTRKFVAQATLDIESFPKGTLDLPGFVVSVVGTMISGSIRSSIRGVSTKMVNGDELIHNEVGSAIYEKYLPAALEQGLFVPSPVPQIVGHGLEHIQSAMDLCKKGVSAKKLVVTL